MTEKIVFVGGVHGVGKSFLSEPAAQRLGIRYASASRLIREESNAINWDVNKRVGDIDGNQKALISAVQRLIAKEGRLILDGHFVLRSTSSGYSEIQQDVFRELQCAGVILLLTEIDVLMTRLTNRGDLSWTKASLEEFISVETSRATVISRALNIPLIVLHTPTVDEFDAALLRVLRTD
jgi:adenylate kinase